jgi:hypothetical protein
MPTYSFLDISASIDGPGGNFPLGAGAGVDKEGITIAFADDKNKQDVGADGQPLNSLRAAQNGTVTVRLQKTSPVNAMLSAMYNTQKQSSATWGQNTIVVSDTQRGDVYSCQQCAFKKFPDNAYAEEAGMVAWAFDAGIMEPLLGTGRPSL